MMKNKGFTLVELVLVMGMFIVIMLVISSSFERITRTVGQQVKSAETSTEGIIGLEMLRSDLEHAGFGLFWSFTPAYAPSVNYNEVTVSPVQQGIDSTLFNDAVPRAVQVGLTAGGKIIDNSSNTNPEAAYLVIKSTRVALHDTAKKWAYVDYKYTGTNTSVVRSWGGTADDFVPKETVITLNTTFTTTGIPAKVLAMASTTGWYYALGGPPPVQPSLDAFKPGDASQLFIAYGVGVPPDGSILRMPYNRADYYIRRPAISDATYKMPESCNPGTGILFKGVVQHADGKFAEYPLLNCVGDMQVDFELGDVANETATSFQQAQTFSLQNRQTGTPADIRDQLKNVYVYILAHEGKKDPNYTYPNNAIQVGDPARPTSSGKNRDNAWMSATFGPDWRNYRWKVYTIAVHPKNLD
ncbi:MAG TPA: type II secretion system protein [Geobacteraceae bacterium]